MSNTQISISRPMIQKNRYVHEVKLLHNDWHFSKSNIRYTISLVISSAMDIWDNFDYSVDTNNRTIYNRSSTSFGQSAKCRRVDPVTISLLEPVRICRQVKVVLVLTENTVTGAQSGPTPSKNIWDISITYSKLFSVHKFWIPCNHLHSHLI